MNADLPKGWTNIIATVCLLILLIMHFLPQNTVFKPVFNPKNQRKGGYPLNPSKLTGIKLQKGGVPPRPNYGPKSNKQKYKINYLNCLQHRHCHRDQSSSLPSSSFVFVLSRSSQDQLQYSSHVPPKIPCNVIGLYIQSKAFFRIFQLAKYLVFLSLSIV